MPVAAAIAAFSCATLASDVVWIVIVEPRPACSDAGTATLTTKTGGGESGRGGEDGGEDGGSDGGS